MSANGEPKTPAIIADVGAQRVARVYAEALLKAAERQGAADSVLEELDSLITDVFVTSPQIEQFLGSGAIGRSHKAEVIRSVFASRASETFLNFLLVLNDHDRLTLLRSILTSCRELRDARLRRIRVQVRTAVPLPDDQRQRLEHELRETFGQEPILEPLVDPELLGGMVVRVGDWLYDASVRTQLASIRGQLLERSSHEIQVGRDRFRTD